MISLEDDDDTKKYESICSEYHDLKLKEEPSKEERELYDKLKKRFDEDRPYKVYLKAMCRMKSDYIFLNSGAKLSAIMFSLWCDKKFKRFNKILNIIVGLVNNINFNYLSFESQDFYFFFISKVLKLGDTKTMKMLEKFISDLKERLFSISHAHLGPVKGLLNIVKIYLDNTHGKSCLSLEKIIDRRKIFQEKILLSIFLLVVDALSSIGLDDIKKNSFQYHLRNALLKIFLFISRNDFVGMRPNFDEKKIYTTKFNIKFQPPSDWIGLIHSSPVIVTLFRILKYGATDHDTEMLVLCCLTQFSTLTSSGLTLPIPFYGFYVDQFLLRLAETIERSAQTMTRKSLLYLTNCLRVFHKTHFSQDSVEYDYFKYRFVHQYEKTFLKLFDIIMKNYIDTKKEGKVERKTLYFYMSFLKDMKKQFDLLKLKFNDFEIYSPEEFFITSFKTFLEFHLVKPFEKLSIEPSSVDKGKKLTKDVENKVTKLIKYSPKRIIAKIAGNDIFLQELFQKLKKMAGNFFYLNILKDFVSNENLFKKDCFLNLMYNLSALLSITKTVFTVTYWSKSIDLAQKYARIFRSNNPITQDYIHNFFCWNESVDYSSHSQTILNNELRVEPYAGIYVTIFIITKMIISSIISYGYRNLMSNSIINLLRCINKISKLSDDLLSHDFYKLKKIPGTEESLLPFEATGVREGFFRASIQYCYTLYKLLYDCHYKTSKLCIRAIKGFLNNSIALSMGDQEFLKEFQKNISIFLINMFNSANFGRYYTLTHLCGIYINISLNLSNPSDREYSYFKLGLILREIEINDYNNISSNRLCENFELLEIFRTSRISSMVGVMGILNNFPRTTNHRDDFRMVFQYFVLPLIETLPHCWVHQKIFSVCLHYFAKFSIEVISLISFYGHKKIEIDSFIKMLSFSTSRYNLMMKDKFCFIFYDKVSRLNSEYKYNHFLMIILGMKLIELYKVLEYHESNILALREMKKYSQMAIQNILGGIITNINIKYAYADNIIYSLAKLTAQYMTIYPYFGPLNLDNMSTMSFILSHGISSEQFNNELCLKGISSTLVHMNAKKTLHQKDDCNKIASFLFRNVYLQIIKTNEELHIKFRLFEVLMIFICYHYHSITDTLKETLEKAKFSYSSINHNISIMSELKIKLGFESIMKYENKICFPIFQKWYDSIKGKEIKTINLMKA